MTLEEKVALLRSDWRLRVRFENALLLAALLACLALIGLGAWNAPAGWTPL